MTSSSEARHAVADPTSPATTGEGPPVARAGAARGDSMRALTHTPTSPTFLTSGASAPARDSEAVENLSRAVAALAETVRLLTQRLGATDTASAS
jgi:hypothetical protein